MRYLIFALLYLMSLGSLSAQAVHLLNVSYDPTRELYQEINQHFSLQWKTDQKQELIMEQSHGGSGKQARSVIDGLEADVVTLALAYDIDQIARIAKLLPENWQSRLPHNSSPYTSTIVFLVRKGNPRQIRDWNDLVKDGISVITPNPKTSGGARWNYLAAWGYAGRLYANDQKQMRGFMSKLFKNVPVLDSGARAATMTFVKRSLGDVLITWENEAFLALNEFGSDFEIVRPPLSILAEPPVAWLDRNVEKHNSQALAKAYLEYLYTPAAQEIIAKHYYRPRRAEVLKKYSKQFPALELLEIDRDFKGWQAAQEKHFNDGGIFDHIAAEMR